MVPKTEKHGKIPENAAKIPFPKVPLNNHLYEYNLGRTFKNYALIVKIYTIIIDNV